MNNIFSLILLLSLEMVQASNIVSVFEVAKGLDNIAETNVNHGVKAAIKKGQMLTLEGQTYYVKDLLSVANSLSVESKEDLLIIYGYLWDADYHVRIIAYLSLRIHIETSEKQINYPVVSLRKVGSRDFELLVQNIASKILSFSPHRK